MPRTKEYVESKFDEELGGQITMANVEITSVQEHFIRDGYSCTRDELNATLGQVQQAASASASASAP